MSSITISRVCQCLARNGSLTNEKPYRESKTSLSSLRSQKSQSQKMFWEAVAGKNHGGERVKKRRKNCGAEALPVVSRAEVEEVGWRHLS